MAELSIPLRSHDEAIQVLGAYDRNAKLLRQSLDIELYTRGGNLRLKGKESDISEAKRRVEHLLGKLRKGRELHQREVEEIMGGGRSDGDVGRDGRVASAMGGGPERFATSAPRQVRPRPRDHDGLAVRPRAIEARGANQRKYLEAMDENTLTFAIGVAGTGKTFLAVAAAVKRLRDGECRRLVITRPVVEAGENLGFLPGDLQAKLNPYMRPVYDSLFDLIGFEETQRLEEAGIIEVAPLAYMRGRTLGDAFVILDEAQNTSASQMKMFLTRLGEGSCMVVTGDPTQSDLPGDRRSGLNDAVHRLRGQTGVAVVQLEAKDIVRHPLVQKIVRAYEGPPPSGEPER